MVKKADMIVDLQYGSTGKGLIAGYKAVNDMPDVVITANMPNAGHTFIDHQGNKMVHKVLPNGLVSPRCRYVLIGPGAVFDMQRLLHEYHDACLMGYDQYQIYIHHAAVMLQPEHKEAEAANVKIGSTMQGSGAAMMAKILRDPDNNPTIGAMHEEILNLPRNIHVVNNRTYLGVIQDAEYILLEGAQGFSLSVNEKFYPYCTSRDTGPARFLSDMGVPVPYLNKVIGSARVHPIRVGSPAGGYSGDCYSDQMELTWDDIGVEAELTTVTKRERRVFTWSHNQFTDAMNYMMPDEIFLNFCNYDPTFAGQLIEEINPRYTGWGPTVDDVRREW